VDRPVELFLRYGGRLAEDFVDRCLDLVSEAARSSNPISTVALLL